MLLLEKSPNGAFFAYPIIAPLRLYDFIDGKGSFLITIYILFAIVFGYNLQKVMHLTPMCFIIVNHFFLLDGATNYCRKKAVFQTVLECCGSHNRCSFFACHYCLCW